MKYAGTPWGMWVLFAKSFQKQLTRVLGYDAAAAAQIRRSAKPKIKRSSRRFFCLRTHSFFHECNVTVSHLEGNCNTR